MDTFYEKFKKDQHASKFLTDPTEDHGRRMALWIEQKMTGNGCWTASADIRR